MKLFGIAIICNACSTNQENNAEKKEFLVTSPIIMDTNYVSEYVADIHSLQNVEIRSKIKGHLEHIYVDEGSSVKTGQVLFSIHKEGFQLELLKAQSKLKSALAELKVDELELENVKKLHEKKYCFKNRVRQSSCFIRCC